MNEPSKEALEWREHWYDEREKNQRMGDELAKLRAQVAHKDKLLRLWQENYDKLGEEKTALTAQLAEKDALIKELVHDRKRLHEQLSSREGGATNNNNERTNWIKTASKY